MGSLRFTSIETYNNIRLNILAYGLTGAGKTTLLGSAQECEFTAPILILDIDGGMVSLSGSKAKIVRPKSMSEIQDIYDYLRHDNIRFRSVGMDTLTELQRKLSMGEIRGTIEADLSYTNLADATPPHLYDWLSSGDQVRRVIRAFRDLAYLPEKEKRIHVIFTAQEKVDDKQNIICPDLPGKLGLEVGGSVDLMGRLSERRVEVKEVMRDAYHMAMKKGETEDGQTYLAKTRTPLGSKFPRAMWNPTIDKLVRQWMSQGDNK